MKTIRKQIKEIDKLKEHKVGKLYKLRASTTTAKFPDIHILGKGENGKTVIKKTFGINEASFKNLCNILNIPEEYILNCPPSLRAANINHWLQRIEKDRKVSLFVDLRERINAIVDDSVANMAFSNFSIISIFEDLFDRPSIIYKEISDYEMQIGVTFIDKPLCFEEDNAKKGVFPVIYISNSETSSHVFRLDLGVYREESNTIILLAPGKKRFYRPKKETTIEILRDDINKAIQSLPNRINTVKGLVDKARNKEIKDFMLWIKGKRRKHKFNSMLDDRAAEIFEKQEKTLWGACNALAKVANEKLKGEKRYNIISMIGLFLN